MTSTDLIRRLHQHRQWVNQRLLVTVDSLSESQLRQPFSIGHGSIWKTLTHRYAAEYVSQYTTAQLVNRLRQAGQSDLPDVMLISMAREETS